MKTVQLCKTNQTNKQTQTVFQFSQSQNNLKQCYNPENTAQDLQAIPTMIQTRQM